MKIIEKYATKKPLKDSFARIRYHLDIVNEMGDATTEVGEGTALEFIMREGVSVFSQDYLQMRIRADDGREFLLPFSQITFP